MKLPRTSFSYILIFLCALSLHGVKAQEIGKDRARPTERITKVSWDVVGGGDLAFEILKDGQEFSILVSRYRFKQVEHLLQLTNAAKDAFELAKELFEGTMDPHTETFVLKEHESSGMFVSITLEYMDGRREKIESIKPSGKLRPLYDFVDSNFTKDTIANPQ